MSTEQAPVPRHRGAPAAILVACMVMLVAGVALGLRVATVCDGDVACALVAGDRFTDPVASGLPTVADDGYDAQFFHRQVRSPFDFAMEERNGVAFDTEVRYGRIAYPLAGWVLSGGGQPPAVPWAMFAVGILSLGGLAWVFAEGARDAGRSAWWGAVAAAIPGVWFAAGRGLADPMSTALVAAGALAIARRRHGLAAVAFTVAVLTKEQAALVIGVYGAWRIFELLRRRGPGPGSADLPWVVPGVVFGVWQLVLLVTTGAAPAAVSGGSHIVVPFSDLLPAVTDWLTPGGFTQLLWLAEVLVFLGLAVVVLFSARSTPWERGVGVAGVLFIALLNDFVFVDPAHFRQLGEISAVLILAAFRADPRWWIPLLGANAVVSIGVVERIITTP